MARIKPFEIRREQRHEGVWFVVSWWWETVHPSPRALTLITRPCSELTAELWPDPCEALTAPEILGDVP